MTPQVALFTKPNCSLCDEALEQIELARQQVQFEIEAVNILSDPAVYERYKNDIPVIVVNGVEAFRYRLTAEALLSHLRELPE